VARSSGNSCWRRPVPSSSIWTPRGSADDRERPLFRRFAKDSRTLERAPLTRATFWRIVKKYCVQAGIPPDRLGVHSLRKSSLNNAIENGAQLHEVRELAGLSVGAQNQPASGALPLAGNGGLVAFFLVASPSAARRRNLQRKRMLVARVAGRTRR
jgi:hypothetical protein